MLNRIDTLGGPEAHKLYAWGWAWAGKTPFRLWKHYTWLGGVRVPLVAHWPAQIPATDAGEVRGQFCHAIDLMPTILEAAGVGAPKVLDGVSQQPIDGASMAATFSDPSAPSPRHTQYFEMAGSRAIYHDGWKATTNHVTAYPMAERERVEGSRDFETDEWSLFNLTDDLSESRDLAKSHPARLQHLIELWWSEAGRHQVLPLMDDLTARQAASKPTVAA